MVFRVLVYLWVAPISAIGLCLSFLALATGGRIRVKEGVVETSGGWTGWLLRGNRLWRGGSAMTFGHVILARDQACLDHSRPHELVHVRQFERWGVFLLPVYLVIACWLSWRGYDPHLDHPFEREAYERGGSALS